MTKILKTLYVATVAFIVSFTPLLATAQQAQMLSVTPPLFQISVAPGDVWQSSIKVVNGNSYPLTVYADVTNFAPEGEKGQGKFIPLTPADGTSTIASWIHVGPGPYVIPPEQTKEISFFLNVPKDASPGGHFAAILIGTKPPTDKSNLEVFTSQTVTTLFFARIEGDVVEKGDIRQFSVTHSFLQKPKADFVLRFENKGNVQLQPRGNIVITNMWGSERGVIPINENTLFGNVLPKSIREFNFSWNGENSLTEIGRYKAVVTLAYGQEGIQNTSSITYFWVIPLKPTLITLGSVLAFMLFVTWAIKLYVRRMLSLAGLDVHNDKREEKTGRRTRPGDINLSSYERVSRPITVGAHEFTNELKKGKSILEFPGIIWSFVRRYKWFFISIVVIALTIAGAALFISNASIKQKAYKVTIDQNGEQKTMNSEEAIKKELEGNNQAPVNNEQRFNLSLINESGVAGVAANASLTLEKNGYNVTTLDTSLDTARPKTIVVYDQSLEEEARALSSLFNNALMSSIPSAQDATSSTTTKPTIKIFFGKDTVEK